jgi:putative transposase
VSVAMKKSPLVTRSRSPLVEHEVRLESYDTLASVDLLAGHMVASMLAGLSGRRYQAALEPVGETIEATASGTSQSSVSRRFITATAARTN